LEKERQVSNPFVYRHERALTKEDSKLFNAHTETEQEKAKTFLVFSYACNGMNIKDIALLKFKNIHR
jgi:hypothetical protein